MSSNQQPNSEIKSGAPASPLRKLLGVVFWLGIVAVVVLAAVVLAGRIFPHETYPRENAAITQISSFSSALDAFEVDNSYYPKALQDLVVQPREALSWHGPYLREFPKDPWGHDYVYQYPGQHNTDGFDLSSMGPNGRAGDKDDITNWKRS